MYVFRRISNNDFKHGVCITIRFSFAKLLLEQCVAILEMTLGDWISLAIFFGVAVVITLSLKKLLDKSSKLSIIFILIWKVSGTHLQDAVVLGVVTPTANFPG